MCRHYFSPPKKEKLSSVLYVVGPSGLFHFVKVAHRYIFFPFFFLYWQNVICIHHFLDFALFVFCMSDHICVLSDRNSDLPGTCPFKRTKIFTALCTE